MKCLYCNTEGIIKKSHPKQPDYKTQECYYCIKCKKYMYKLVEKKEKKTKIQNWKLAYILILALSK